MIQYVEYEAFVEAKENARGKQPIMDMGKICAIRERLREDPVGVGSEISADTRAARVRRSAASASTTRRSRKAPAPP